MGDNVEHSEILLSDTNGVYAGLQKELIGICSHDEYYTSGYMIHTYT